jgi:anti-sigma regulatory factor (Ser/Thr protein kinase)
VTSSAPGLSQTFQPAPESVRAARRLVGAALESVGDDPAADQAVLLVSELATNAVLHARTQFRIEVVVDADVVRVAVFDQSPVRPSRRNFSDTSGSGRGLHLVDELATSWGVDEEPPAGKRVWFEVRLHEEPAISFDLDAVETL